MSDHAERRGVSLAAAFLQLQIAGDEEGQDALFADVLRSDGAREFVAGLSGFAVAFGSQLFGEGLLDTLRQMVFGFQPDGDL